MKTTLSVLSTLAITALLGLPACVTDAGGPTGEASEALLYGLSEAEVASLLPLASSPLTPEAWLDLHRGPFDCGNYGDLCRRVGPDAAYSITERSYHLGLDHATRDEINAFLATEIDAAVEPWKVASAKERDDERDSTVVTNTGTGVDERVRTEIFAVKPLVGDWYVQDECTFQTLGAFGIWGGSDTANLKATLSGNLRDGSGNPYDQSGTYVTATILAHSITTSKFYFYPDLSTDGLHGHGECDASKGAWSAHAAANVFND